MAAIDIQILLQNNNSKSLVPRYKIINGKRLKFQEYQALENSDPVKLEELKLGEINWDQLDLELNKLHQAWEKEIDPIKKEILLIKYDLAIESWIKTEDNHSEIINELSQKIKKLESLLNL